MPRPPITCPLLAQWKLFDSRETSKYERREGATTSCKSTWETVPYFGIKWPVHHLVLVIPPPPLIKVASNTRPYSKLGGTTVNGREEGGQYYISQTCDQERFEARKVVFSWKCLNIFATGCSLSHPSTFHKSRKKFGPGVTYISFS